MTTQDSSLGCRKAFANPGIYRGIADPGVGAGLGGRGKGGLRARISPAPKKQGILSFATTWVNLAGTTLSQVKAVGVPLLVCGETKKVHLLETKGQCVVARGWGWCGGGDGQVWSAGTPSFTADKLWGSNVQQGNRSSQ